MGEGVSFLACGRVVRVWTGISSHGGSIEVGGMSTSGVEVISLARERDLRRERERPEAEETGERRKEAMSVDSGVEMLKAIL